ncbi:hypothetical protein JY96_16160 [Aquabacterium sp. NJ1]|nr:hypothetical protein JY96_16160 [Aquabacterium sp. NJ1]
MERSLTVPLRLLGGRKSWIKPHLPWAAVYQQERALLDAVQETRPDVLLVMSYVRYRPQVLARCRKLGVKRLVGWFIEGPEHDFRAESEAPLYDRYFCIHRHLAPDSLARISWLPTLLLDTRHFFPLPGVVKRNKVVFVGGKTARRVRFLSALIDLPLEIWGPGGWGDVPELAGAFRGEFIWGERLNQLYNEAALVVNLSTWEPSLGGLTQRVMDVPATGTLLMTDACEDLLDFFKPGVEVITFSSPQELADQCRYFLAHPGARDAIARAGLRRAHRGATGLDIARQLLS